MPDIPVSFFVLLSQRSASGCYFVVYVTLYTKKDLEMRLLLCVLFLSACTGSVRQGVADPPPHDIWDALLQKHVDDSGWVNYDVLIEDWPDLRKELTEHKELLLKTAKEFQETLS